MCGIAGFLRHRAEALLKPESILQDMTDAIAHRGPDGEGHWVEGPAYIGHRRLSIIDLDHGAQPMLGARGQVLSFNGEIYNYLELRAELQMLGHQFETESDTEVLLQAFEEWGPKCLDRFNGMFAFAIWLPQERRLFIARDRMGKKPLFYVANAGFFAFASEISALNIVPEVHEVLKPDIQAMADFLALGYILGEKTIYRQIRQLPAGHFGWIEQGTPELQIQKYWFVEEAYQSQRPNLGKPEVERFRSLFDSATELRLRSDRPLSVFLSGGQDSAAVLASLVSKDHGGLRALTMGFEDPRFDETTMARDTARHLGVQATRLAHGAISDAPLVDAIKAVGEPFADTSMMAMMELCQAARDAGYPVALSGDGADEILAGYPTYKADRYYGFYRRMPKPLADLALILAKRFLKPEIGKVTLDYKVRQFLSSHGLSPTEAHYWWRSLFSDDQIRQIIHPDLIFELGDYRPFDHFQSYFDVVSKAGFLNQCLYVDLKTWLVDDILVKMDRASMAHGLEVRSPFLDYRVVEYCAGLPDAAKFSGGRQKALLKMAFQDQLPGAVFNARKRGFNAPTADYIQDRIKAASSTSAFNPDFRLDPKRDNISYTGFAFAALDHWLDQAPGMAERVG